ncbi:hypothetical protein AJ79_09601 [Helicocarpus griseus UAMH5409]|uniref:Uncharacterized protein n=1 Tax=Helicocarpus griseus UAMH5409 TaxID=1447875 RepID=A0A2B7WIF6_9EURO|nr:hypothetical protein AJ79_09601 [Helicocarpus griseus UAMH5409]
MSTESSWRVQANSDRGPRKRNGYPPLPFYIQASTFASESQTARHPVTTETARAADDIWESLQRRPQTPNGTRGRRRPCKPPNPPTPVNRNRDQTPPGDSTDNRNTPPRKRIARSGWTNNGINTGQREQEAKRLLPGKHRGALIDYSYTTHFLNTSQQSYSSSVPRLSALTHGLRRYKSLIFSHDVPAGGMRRRYDTSSSSAPIIGTNGRTLSCGRALKTFTKCYPDRQAPQQRLDG